jgi:hypothetical protein
MCPALPVDRGEASAVASAAPSAAPRATGRATAQGLMDSARCVIGCHLTQETRVHIVTDDVACTIHMSLSIILMDSARHVIGCNLITETRVHNASDDVVSTIRQSLPRVVLLPSPALRPTTPRAAVDGAARGRAVEALRSSDRGSRQQGH